MIYTVSLRDVDEEGLFEIMSVKKVVLKSKSTLSTVNLASTFGMIVNSMLIVKISL